jgi:arylsulfatase A-like enzyme
MIAASMRRRAIAIGLLAGACGQTPAILPARPSASPSPARKPSIILILTDDLDARTLETLPVMPEVLERLGRGGTTFSRSYASSPLCCPSRVSILTGRYPHNTGIVSNDAPGGFTGFFRSGQERDTVATQLKAAGYRTAILGKYLNGYPYGAYGEYIPPGWDEACIPHVLPGYFDYGLNDNGRVVYHGTAEEDYLTDVLAAKALDFIGRAAAADQPFFLFLSITAPHKPALPAPRHGLFFPRLEAPRLPSFDEELIDDKPSWVRRKPRFDQEDIRHLDKGFRRRAQTLGAVDEAVARIDQKLRETGQYDRTYVLFSSDNGWLNGEHRYPEGKALMYEESIRVPLLVRGPGVPAGVTLDSFVSNVDLMPTFLEWAGRSIPPEVDGRSLVPLLNGGPRPAEWRRDVLVEFLDPAGSESPPYAVLRTADWAYASYWYEGVPFGGERELYDMRDDPYELRNVAYEMEPVARPLQERLAALSSCRGAACR